MGTSQIILDSQATLSDAQGSDSEISAPDYPTSLPVYGSIEFLSLDEPSLCEVFLDSMDLSGFSAIRDSDLAATARNIYPATKSLLDSEELGMFFLAGPTQEVAAHDAEQIRKRLNTAFAPR